MSPGQPRAAVARAIENLVARRLGRLFVPLAALLVFGAVWAFLAPPAERTVPLVVAVAAPLAAASALAQGLRTVRRALGAPPRSWTGPLAAGGVPVWLYGLVVLGLGLRGLRDLAGPEPLSRGLPAAVLVLLAGVALRAWWRLGEVREMVALLERLPGED